MRRQPVSLAIVLFAAGLVAGGEARAQLTCTPNRLRAGEELRIGSPGAFGGAPSAEVTLSYGNGGTINRHFGSPRSWSTREVAFLLPSDLPDGVYFVTLASPSGALRNPSCFTIGPPLVAVTTIRGPMPGPTLPTLDIVVDGDWPCSGETMVTLWGKLFTPGTEALVWSAGKTAVEFSGDGAPSAPAPRGFNRVTRLTIRNAGTIEVMADRCILLLPGLKARISFPDGSKSAWVRVRTEWDHP